MKCSGTQQATIIQLVDSLKNKQDTIARERSEHSHQEQEHNPVPTQVEIHKQRVKWAWVGRVLIRPMRCLLCSLDKQQYLHRMPGYRILHNKIVDDGNSMRTHNTGNQGITGGMHMRHLMRKSPKQMDKRENTWPPCNCARWTHIGEGTSKFDSTMHPVHHGFSNIQTDIGKLDRLTGRQTHQRMPIMQETITVWGKIFKIHSRKNLNNLSQRMGFTLSG